ncbi:uncharacterized protein LOC143620757 [Bidens hawaiensis]|uniref:uncharacterized protein LOC143620757 n=1 Tax=Bidens hawaiensis TaxID=980011 RepID=UPI0040496B63
MANVKSQLLQLDEQKMVNVKLHRVITRINFCSVRIAGLCWCNFVRGHLHPVRAIQICSISFLDIFAGINQANLVNNIITIPIVTDLEENYIIIVCPLPISFSHPPFVSFLSL